MLKCDGYEIGDVLAITGDKEVGIVIDRVVHSGNRQNFRWYRLENGLEDIIFNIDYKYEKTVNIYKLLFL